MGYQIYKLNSGHNQTGPLSEAAKLNNSTVQNRLGGSEDPVWETLTKGDDF